MKTKKLLALLLAAVMMCSLLPVTALADGGGTQEPSPNPNSKKERRSEGA